MSELYCQPPEVDRPHSVATLAHLNLTDFEDYLYRVKQQIEDCSLLRLEINGVYHALSSTEISPSDLTTLLEQRGTFELRFVDENDELVQLPIRYLYAEQRVFILDSINIQEGEINPLHVNERPVPTASTSIHLKKT